MEINNAIDQLSALAHESRLSVYRLLVRKGKQGMPAGELCQSMRMPPATMNFHLTQLKHAGLLNSRREGRNIYYAAAYGAMHELMTFLTENCCTDDPNCGGNDSSNHPEEK